MKRQTVTQAEKAYRELAQLDHKQAAQVFYQTLTGQLPKLATYLELPTGRVELLLQDMAGTCTIEETAEQLSAAIRWRNKRRKEDRQAAAKQATSVHAWDGSFGDLGRLLSEAHKAGAVDLVTVNHDLEHVIPVALMRRAHRLLASAGRVDCGIDYDRDMFTFKWHHDSGNGHLSLNTYEAESDNVFRIVLTATEGRRPQRLGKQWS